MTHSTAFHSRRSVASHRRQPPIECYKFIVDRNGDPQWYPQAPLNETVVPGEIWFQTNVPAQGSPADPSQSEAWNIERWLRELPQRWAEKELVFCILSFDLGLAEADVLDRLASIIPARWRVVLVTDGRDLISTAMIDRILRSCINEVQIYPAGLTETGVNQRVLHATKDLIDLRQARGQNLPKIVCRICAKSGNAPAELTQWARQVGIDRLDIEKPIEAARLWQYSLNVAENLGPN
jgi:hypothetical protein